MANKVCMSVEKVINWKWKWANHSYKIFLIKNNTKLYSKINERCGFFFFFFDEHFFSSNGFGITWRQKGFHVMVLFLPPLSSFWRLKWCPTVPTPRRSVLPTLSILCQNGIFFLFNFFQFYLSNLHYQSLKFGHEISGASWQHCQEDPHQSFRSLATTLVVVKVWRETHFD